MDKIVKVCSTLFAATGAWISAKLGILQPLIMLLMLMMALDYITGMLASKTEAIQHPGEPGYGWSSKIGAQGIIKKVGYLCVIAAAMVVDYIIMNVAGALGIETSVKAFFALLAVVWYILNELLSIIENSGRMGADVPEWLRKYISVLRDTIDSKAEEENK